MENQHRKITGYRELNEAEIAMLNDAKANGPRLEASINAVRQYLDANHQEIGIGEFNDAQRWTAVAQTHFQQGLMALGRAITRPEGFG